MVNNINSENNTNCIINNCNNNLNDQQLELQSFELPTTFTKYINNTVGANMLNCDFEMNDTKLVGVDMMTMSNEIGGLEADDTITDNTTFEINNLNSNKFKNKLTHPLSSSILKTTKSILDSTENNPNFNTYGTSSNGSIDNSTATNTLNYNILMEQTTLNSNNDNTLNSINLNNETDPNKESDLKHKSILKQRNKSSSSKNNSIKDTSDASNSNYHNMETSLSPQANNVSYFKMFESFLCEKKASFKSGLRSIQNIENALSSKNNKQSEKLKSLTTPPLRATMTDAKTPIRADLITISSLVSEAHNNGFLTVNIDQENKLKQNKSNVPKVSPIYSLRSSSIHSSMSSSIISPTSSFLITETNKNSNNHHNNNPFEDLEEDDNCNMITTNHNHNNDCSSSDEQDDNITKTNDNDFTISINNSNIMNTPITNNETTINNSNNNNLSAKPRLNSYNNNNNNNNTKKSNVINHRFKSRVESIISNTNHKVELRSVFLKVGDIDTLNEKFFAEAFIEVNFSTNYFC